MDDTFADDSDSSDEGFPPFPGEVIAGVIEQSNRGNEQLHIVVKPIDADFGPFHSWFDLPAVDPETGRRKPAKAGSKYGIFKGAVSKFIRTASGDPVSISGLKGAHAMWERKVITFGNKDVKDADGNQVFEEDGVTKVTEQIKSKPTLLPVGSMAAKVEDAELDGDTLLKMAAFFEGKTDAEIQSQVNRASFSAEEKKAILSGRAKKALINADLIEKGDDRKYALVGVAA